MLLLFLLKLQLQMQPSGIEMCASCIKARCYGKHKNQRKICRILPNRNNRNHATFKNFQKSTELDYCERFLCIVYCASPLACQLLHLAIIPLPRNKSGREQGILQNCRSSRTIDLHLKRPKGIRTMPRITLNSVRSVQH